MEALLYFAFWAALIFLMMRVGCGAHIMGRGHGEGRTGRGPGKRNDAALRWVPPESDIDPVCGETVTPDKAKPSLHAGNVYYFCSRDCREVFEAAPHHYVDDDDADRPRLEHSHA